MAHSLPLPNCDNIVSKPQKRLIIIIDEMCFVMMTKCLSALPFGSSQQEAVNRTLQINASLLLTDPPWPAEQLLNVSPLSRI